MEESEIIQHLHCYTVLLSTANVDFNSGLSIPERDVILEKKGSQRTRRFKSCKLELHRKLGRHGRRLPYVSFVPGVRTSHTTY